MLNREDEKPQAGLYLVAVPIGSARDITLRALDLLAGADVIAAEDTRAMRRLMDIHGVAPGDRPLLAYHDHNGARMRPRLLAELEAGKSVVYASEAGSPLVADPGYALARDARAAGHRVTTAPGPSAVIAALTVGALPTDRFLFAGFLPNATGQRKSALAELTAVPATLAFYESPKRLAAMLRDAAAVLGEDRRAAICRELTKKFEEVIPGTLSELAQIASERTLKGEIVVLVDRGHSSIVKEDELNSLLAAALGSHSLRDAVDAVTAQTGLPRRTVYKAALKIGG